MKVTKKLELALDLVSEVRKSSNPSRLEDLSAQINCSLPFLQQIARKLRMGGILSSVRGPGGGYVLTSNRSFTAKEIAATLGIKNKTTGGTEPVNRLRDALADAYNFVTV